MRSLTSLLCAAVLVFGGGQSALAEWGDLTMTFVYDGDPPRPAAVNVTQDQQFCGQHNLVDESLVVNPETRGVKNVVIYVLPARGEELPVHDSYAETADDEVVLDNENCRFEPRVALFRTTQTLVLGNSDPVGHNTNASLLSNPAFNITIPAGGRVERTLAREERMPMPVACNIHPWMRGFLLVRESPYMAVSDEDGKIEIKNLPAGEWTFQVWHESAGYVTEVTQNGQSISWTRGRVEIPIAAGENDLGTFSIAPGAFRN